jgi:Transglycosylase SLT domain
MPMPFPRLDKSEQRQKIARVAGVFALAGICLLVPGAGKAQIASEMNADGRRMFVNAEPVTIVKLGSLKAATPKAIYLGGEISFMGQNRPALTMDRDGAEKLVKEAAERHRVDPALIRAVIETESNWNAAARSHKGAQGLMQLIPTTAMRFGVNDAYNPQQNVDAGVRYLKTLLERYDGNLDLALAAYNAGEGAVDRAHGIPAYRETRDYVQKVQNAYHRVGSGRLDSAYIRTNAIHRDVDGSGRIIFSNE